VSTVPANSEVASTLCLDLSNNNLTSAALTRISPRVVFLNLTRNPLGDCQLPMFKRLRSLSLDYCGLRSLTGLPSFPDLRHFSASHNKLRSYFGLPVFPRLEYINLSNNPFNFTPELTILAVGSVWIESYNDTEITEAQLRAAFSLSPLVGFSLRQGRDPARQGSAEAEVRCAQTFLTADLVNFLNQNPADLPKYLPEGSDSPVTVLTVYERDDHPQLICPFVSPRIGWSRNLLIPALHQPIAVEWQRITRIDRDTEPENILPLVEYKTRLHLIRCEFELAGYTFCIYTDYPINREEGELSLPIPIDPDIVGVPNEGALMSLIPLAIPTRLAWSSGEAHFATDVQSVTLGEEHIGRVITCQLQPYCPKHPRLSFSMAYASSHTPVGPMSPTVSELGFPDMIIEGVSLNFTRVFYPPDCEGASEISVEHSFYPSSDWVKIADLQPNDLSFTPRTEDVGLFLRI
jgi:hypothetical protein